MRGWLVLLAGAAVGCSSLGPGGGTTGIGGTRSSGTTGSGGSAKGGASAGGSSAAGGNTGGSVGPGGAGNGGTGSGGGNGGAGTGGAPTGGSGGAGTGGAGGAGAAPDSGTGGSGGGTGGSGAGDASTDAPSVDPQQACNAMAESYCAKLQECSSFLMSVAFGNQTTCKARWILNCTPNFGAPGTSATPARTSACAQSIPTLSCTTFLGGDLGPACAVGAGTVANGAACGDDAQCASTFCARPTTAVCGTCQPVTNPGVACVQGSCSISTNTICSTGTTTCVRPKAGKIGDACVGQEECDVGHQVGCNPATQKCIALTLAGATCGANSIFASSIAVCPSAGTCSASVNGTCTAAGADGASCVTTETGTHCMLPARCVGGRCTLPNPSTCR